MHNKQLEKDAPRPCCAAHYISKTCLTDNLFLVKNWMGIVATSILSSPLGSLLFSGFFHTKQVSALHPSRGAVKVYQPGHEFLWRRAEEHISILPTVTVVPQNAQHYSKNWYRTLCRMVRPSLAYDRQLIYHVMWDADSVVVCIHFKHVFCARSHQHLAGVLQLPMAHTRKLLTIQIHQPPHPSCS